MLVTRVLIFLMLALLLGACSHVERRAAPHGETALIGVIEIFPAGRGAASLGMPDGSCVDLALPKHVLERHSEWNGRVVHVSGRFYSIPTDQAALWFQVLDRKIEGGGCSPRVLYVTSIRK